MGRCFALGKRKILLRRIFCSRRRTCGISGGGRLEGEKTFEDALCLPLSGVREVNPYIHAPRTAECRVQTLDVICGRKQESGNKIRTLLTMEICMIDHGPTFPPQLRLHRDCSGDHSNLV